MLQIQNAPNLICKFINEVIHALFGHGSTECTDYVRPSDKHQDWHQNHTERCNKQCILDFPMKTVFKDEKLQNSDEGDGNYEKDGFNSVHGYILHYVLHECKGYFINLFP